jgi:hypothetical protein
MGPKPKKNGGQPDAGPKTRGSKQKDTRTRTPLQRFYDRRKCDARNEAVPAELQTRKRGPKPSAHPPKGESDSETEAPTALQRCLKRKEYAARGQEAPADFQKRKAGRPKARPVVIVPPPREARPKRKRSLPVESLNEARQPRQNPERSELSQRELDNLMGAERHACIVANHKRKAERDGVEYIPLKIRSKKSKKSAGRSSILQASSPPASPLL